MAGSWGFLQVLCYINLEHFVSYSLWCSPRECFGIMGSVINYFIKAAVKKSRDIQDPLKLFFLLGKQKHRATHSVLLGKIEAVTGTGGSCMFTTAHCWLRYWFFRKLNPEVPTGCCCRYLPLHISQGFTLLHKLFPKDGFSKDKVQKTGTWEVVRGLYSLKSVQIKFFLLNPFTQKHSCQVGFFSPLLPRMC